jgi:nucleoside-diphosphate-sugar epimerase
MKVMLIGGTIFIGRELATQLVEAGHEIAFLHRGDHEPPGFDGATHIHVDRKEIASARDEIEAFNPDAVVDNMAMSASDAETALGVIAGRRLLVTSSIDVYRAYTNLMGNVGGEPTPITETSPVRDERYPYRSDDPDAPPMMQTYEKLDVEERYLAHDATVIRLPMVYGPNDGQRREWFILRRVKAGRKQIPVGTGTWMSARGFVRDMARGMRLALESEGARGEIFNLCETKPRSEGDWAQLILDAAGSDAELVRVPDEKLPDDLGMTGTIPQNLDASSEKAQRILGFTDTDPQQALPISVEWHLSNPPKIDDPGFDADDEALKSAGKSANA